jgi:hypothetical protein
MLPAQEDRTPALTEDWEAKRAERAKEGPDPMQPAVDALRQANLEATNRIRREMGLPPLQFEEPTSPSNPEDPSTAMDEGNPMKSTWTELTDTLLSRRNRAALRRDMHPATAEEVATINKILEQASISEHPTETDSSIQTPIVSSELAGDQGLLSSPRTHARTRENPDRD